MVGKENGPSNGAVSLGPGAPKSRRIGKNSYPLGNLPRLTWVYYLYCNLPICAEWKNLEAEAKEAKRGIWSERNPIPPWEFRRKRRGQ
jgi:hypothetical protein